MKIPEFRAEGSLYRTNNHYSTRLPAVGGIASGGAITPAYFPGPATQTQCSSCLSDCSSANADCSLAAIQPLWACVFPPLCPGAAAAAGVALNACQVADLGCVAYCEAFKCCPKLCGFPDPFNPGQGCCDEGENCVDESDPNARDGCCPSNQSVCGGQCCASGDTCCGDSCCPEGFACCGGTCCPPNSHCCGGTCCDANIPCCGDGCCDLFPPGTAPPTPPPNSCPPGSAPCGFPDSSGVVRTCCPPGLQCCNFYEGVPDCKTSCIA